MRLVLALAMILSIGGTGGVLAADGDSLDLKRVLRLTESGSRSLRSGNFPKASKQFVKALTIVPDYPDATLGLGHIAMNERRFEEALALFEAARSSYGSLGGALDNVRMDRYDQVQAQIIASRDRIANLERQLARASSGNRGGGFVATQLRTEIMRTEQLVQKLEGFERPELDSPGTVPGEIHFFIGNALLNLNRTDEAIASWNACVEQTPDFPLVHYNLAVAHWQAGRFETALSSLNEAERLGFEGNPNFRVDLETSLARTRPAADLLTTAD